jgi:hypothetical protein
MSDTVFHETNSSSIWSEAFGGTAPSFPDEGFPLSPNASAKLKKNSIYLFKQNMYLHNSNNNKNLTHILA